MPLVCRTSQRRVSLWHEKSVRLDVLPPRLLVRVYNGLVPGVENPSTDRHRRTFCRDEPERPAASDGWSGGARRGTEPISVMDLENRVSKRPWALPTASRCCQAGNLWISDFKGRTATLSMLSLRPMAEGPIPTRIWIAGGQHFLLAGAVQSPEPRVMQDASFAGEVELYEREIESSCCPYGSCPARRRARITWW